MALRGVKSKKGFLESVDLLQKCGFPNLQYFLMYNVGLYELSAFVGAKSFYVMWSVYKYSVYRPI